MAHKDNIDSRTDMRIADDKRPNDVHTYRHKSAHLQAPDERLGTVHMAVTNYAHRAAKSSCFLLQHAPTIHTYSSG